MSEGILHTTEHQPVAFSAEDLLLLAKEGDCKLIDHIDFKHGLLYPGYKVGVDQLLPLGKVLFVGPKKKAGKRLDYLKMLSVCLQHPDINIHSKDLFDIRFEKEAIKIQQQEDLLTPLLIVQFLRAVERVVRKGLQKGYYNRTENMNCRVKGRVLVAETIKRNHFHHNYLQTWCKYQEFGLDTAPNRILNKTLQFVQRYAQALPKNVLPLGAKLRFLQPAFERVGTEVELREIEHYKPNPFYAEYTEAIRFARLLLKRFGYQLNAVKSATYTDIPPFWIDMSKLFELYALGQLQEAVGSNELVYQADGKFGYLDFLHTAQGEEMIIDAKYKYFYGAPWYDIEDVRQLSAYARDRGILAQLKIPKANWSSTVLPCLIIYPDPNAPVNIDRNAMLDNHIDQFERFHRLGLSLPMLSV
jgi:5-methylcytosine-specific restriction enzyme subunit McrC